MVDPIADFLARIRNTQMAHKTELEVPYSNIKFKIAETMQKNNFLEKVEKDESGKFPLIKIKLLKERPIALKRISHCGQRMYTPAKGIRSVLNGFGISIISTSQGVMTGYEARTKNLGGEILCEIS